MSKKHFEKQPQPYSQTPHGKDKWEWFSMIYIIDSTKRVWVSLTIHIK